ncbi:hypothetical protein COCMIDRAFT_96082, partial [Bipolaris oryzae ATCC 44560]
FEPPVAFTFGSIGPRVHWNLLDSRNDLAAHQCDVRFNIRRARRSMDVNRAAFKISVDGSAQHDRLYEDRDTISIFVKDDWY